MVNPHRVQKGVSPQDIRSGSILTLFRSLARNRHLLLQLAKREISGRYKGSVLGVTWSFLNPLLMIVVYTFVFSVVFKARWTHMGVEVNKAQFAIVLFAGSIIHSLFAEIAIRSPGLIQSNANYVKKVVFPLEILPIAVMLSAFFHSLVSIAVLVAVFIAVNGFIPWTAIFAPFAMVPFLFFTTGLALIVASLGVFLRDMGQIIGIVVMAMLFLSPVFYPLSALPEAARPWLLLNPLTIPIEAFRDLLIWGTVPMIKTLVAYSIFSIVWLWFGFFWFQKTRPGFSDVL